MYHFVAFTPLKINCEQFKDLRVNSLVSVDVKETHTRKTQPDPLGKPFDQKKIGFSQVKRLPSLNGLVSERDAEDMADNLKFITPVPGVIPKVTTPSITNDYGLVPGIVEVPCIERIPNTIPKPVTDGTTPAAPK